MLCGASLRQAVVLIVLPPSTSLLSTLRVAPCGHTTGAVTLAPPPAAQCASHPLHITTQSRVASLSRATELLMSTGQPQHCSHRPTALTAPHPSHDAAHTCQQHSAFSIRVKVHPSPPRQQPHHTTRPASWKSGPSPSGAFYTGCELVGTKAWSSPRRATHVRQRPAATRGIGDWPRRARR